MSRNPEKIITSALGMSPDDLSQLVKSTLQGFDGEGYFSNKSSMAMSYTDQTVEGFSITQNTNGGSFRRICVNEDNPQKLVADLSYFTGLTQSNMVDAQTGLINLSSGKGVDLGFGAPTNIKRIYSEDSVFASKTQEDWIKLAEEIDAYTRGADKRVKKVSISIMASEDDVLIVLADGARLSDPRLMVHMSVSIIMEEGDRREGGRYSFGGRYNVSAFFEEDKWQYAADKAVQSGENALKSIDSPSGSDMGVILGSGWGAIILHEAIGHGFEGDFIRKGTSVFTHKMGQMVAHPEVTIVEDGTLPDRRGSLSVDDEGTPTECTTLIKNGEVVGFMQDKISAYEMGVTPTGNGRRQSYKHKPIPRMTNTYMLPGNDKLDDMIKGIDHGVYVEEMSNGSVDITSGKYVFNASPGGAREIIKGQLGSYLKGVSLSGMGHEVLLGINGISSNLQLDPGVGTCGKDGQSVPAGLGQPELSLKPGTTTVAGTR